MAFRRLYFAAAVSLALVSPAGAGEKIEFSDPSSAWTVPQQDRPEKEVKRGISAKAGPSSGFDSMDVPYVPDSPVFILPPTKGKDKFGSSASANDRNDFDPYDNSDPAELAGPNRMTNGVNLPRAWDKDPSKLSRQPEDQDNRDSMAGSPHWDPLNPFAETDSHKENHFGRGFQDSGQSSFWQGSSRSPLALEGMREGAFIPVNGDSDNSSEETPNSSVLGADDSRNPVPVTDFTRSSSSPFARDNFDTAQNPAFEVRSQDPQAPALVAPPRYAPPVQSYMGSRNEAPSAVLKWPRKPGDLFQ